MLYKVWNIKGEMPYCFPRSSIKFQGHTVQNITDFYPNWAFQIPQICLVMLCFVVVVLWVPNKFMWCSSYILWNCFTVTQSFKVTSQALGQSDGCSSVCKVILKSMGKGGRYLITTIHNKAWIMSIFLWKNYRLTLWDVDLFNMLQLYVRLINNSSVNIT